MENIYQKNKSTKKEKKFLKKKKLRLEKSSEKQKPEPQIKETEFYKDDNIEPEIKEEEKELGLEEIKDKMVTNNTSSVEQKNKNWINKTRILIVASRGVSHQERHLVNDLISLIPNSKKECKIERNIATEELNNICYMHSCKFCIYLEHRKRELVMWLFRSPGGPLAKFSVTNIHALNEIKLIGNCIKYSRPLLSFDKSFEEEEHLKLLKEMFTQCFNSPRGHPKTRPFYDHEICFYNIDNQIFIRVYQILNEIKEKFTNQDQESKIQLQNKLDNIQDINQKWLNE